MTNYQKLSRQFQKAFHINHLVSIAHWDSACNMPKGGQKARAMALSEASIYMHELISDPRMQEWLDASKSENLTPWEVANIREIEWVYRQYSALDEKIVGELSQVCSECEKVWEETKPKNDWKTFLPAFTRLIELKREEAQIKSEAFQLNLYDSLMDHYEPGMNSEQVEIIFAPLREKLPAMIQEALEKQKYFKNKVEGAYPVEDQKKLGLQVMKLLGFDFDHGRLDTSSHPFCGGVPEDVRITTRYDEANFTDSLMGVIHESGHACYEQNLPPAYLDQPVGAARSMSIHEGQSLLFEMQLARSLEFINFMGPVVNKYLGTSFTNEDFTQIYHHVEPGYIRVMADEMTYPMHILLRFEIEKDLIEGKIETHHIPDLWNTKMKEYLGLDTEGKYSQGCMQDIHWSHGGIGYFPSYTLGAMVAAQLFASMRKDVPNFSEALIQGNFSPFKSWLKKNIWSQGSFYSTGDLLKNATGSELDSQFFIQHLRSRYL